MPTNAESSREPLAAALRLRISLEVGCRPGVVAEAVTLLGLGDLAEHPTGAPSTDTRRIVKLGRAPGAVAAGSTADEQFWSGDDKVAGHPAPWSGLADRRRRGDLCRRPSRTDGRCPGRDHAAVCDRADNR